MYVRWLVAQEEPEDPKHYKPSYVHYHTTIWIFTDHSPMIKSKKASEKSSFDEKEFSMQDVRPFDFDWTLKLWRLLKKTSQQRCRKTFLHGVGWIYYIMNRDARPFIIAMRLAFKCISVIVMEICPDNENGIVQCCWKKKNSSSFHFIIAT